YRRRDENENAGGRAETTRRGRHGRRHGELPGEGETDRARGGRDRSLLLRPVADDLPLGRDRPDVRFEAAVLRPLGVVLERLAPRIDEGRRLDERLALRRLDEVVEARGRVAELHLVRLRRRRE